MRHLKIAKKRCAKITTLGEDFKLFSTQCNCMLQQFYKTQKSKEKSAYHQHPHEL